MGHRSGESRQQSALFPVMLDDLVSHSAMVRVVDAWVSSLDMHKLGFQKAQAQVRGAPPYAPADLLKLYIWGYLSAVRSSRQLELECHRNVECMWLLGRLAPDHKTIADFRRLNPESLVKASAAFIDFARSQQLIRSRTVAIDGTKLKAVASRKSVLGHKQLLEQAQRNAEEIAAYLRVLDEQDRQDKDAAECRPQDVLRALDELRAKAARIDQQLQQLADSGVEKLVDTEPQARPMSSLYGAPGYNLQTAVEVESHLIVHHEVCTDANDQRQLLPMARATKQVLDKPTQREDTATDAESPMIAVADGGFVNGEHFAKLEEEKIITFVAPKPGVNPGGLLDRSEFQFDAERDRYICPEGKVLKRKKRSQASRNVVYVAKAKDCGQCSRKPQCTNAAQRSVTKHLHEDAIEANARRVQAHPEMMRLRRQTVEHPFGTIKDHILRGARLLVRGLLPARGETSLAVIAYNLKRVFNMKGSDWMLGALAA